MVLVERLSLGSALQRHTGMTPPCIASGLPRARMYGGGRETTTMYRVVLRARPVVSGIDACRPHADACARRCTHDKQTTRRIFRWLESPRRRRAHALHG